MRLACYVSLMKRMIFGVLCFFPIAYGFELPSMSTQCLVGQAKDWNSSHVTLQLHQKKDGHWVKFGASWNGRLGKT